ncbi:MAG: superoxide dismutase [Phycisphaerales bacterium]
MMLDRSDEQRVVGEGIDRRMALGVMGALGLGAVSGSAMGQGAGGGAGSLDPMGLTPLGVDEFGWDERSEQFVLPKLPYEYGDLEGAIDAQTMEIHHGKHHAGYVRGLNRALRELTAIRAGEGDPDLIKHWSRELAFHGGGHINHSIFWQVMAPAGRGGGGEPDGLLGRAIRRDFGSFERFRTHFELAAGSVEASGWCWLVLDRMSGRLMIQQMEKQQNMLLTGSIPLMGIDVWEHAYYLRYQNRRGEYVSNWFSVINWARVGSILESAVGR